MFAKKAARWDENHEYPWENIEILKELGVLGMTIPEAYGGQESPLIDAVLAIETTAKYCGVTARVIVETNMGALGCVMAYGTDEQRKLVARRILEEGDKPAIGMTEPEAGTALTDLAATAEKKATTTSSTAQSTGSPAAAYRFQTLSSSDSSRTARIWASAAYWWTKGPRVLPSVLLKKPWA